MSDFFAKERSRRRLRYWGYIFNLAVNAFLYGDDPESFEAEIFVNAALAREKAELLAWRKHGLIGKLHNIVVFIRRSPQRREIFIDLADEDDLYTNLMLVLDNFTRWNSVYLIIDRSLSKRCQVFGFIAFSRGEKEVYKKVFVEDELTDED